MCTPPVISACRRLMHYDVKISGARIRIHDLWIRTRVCYPLHHCAPIISTSTPSPCSVVIPFENVRALTTWLYFSMILYSLRMVYHFWRRLFQTPITLFAKSYSNVFIARLLVLLLLKRRDSELFLIVLIFLIVHAVFYLLLSYLPCFIVSVYLYFLLTDIDICELVHLTINSNSKHAFYTLSSWPEYISLYFVPDS